MINEVFGYLNERGLDIEQSLISARQLGQIMDMISERKITGTVLFFGFPTPGTIANLFISTYGQRDY